MTETSFIVSDLRSQLDENLEQIVIQIAYRDRLSAQVADVKKALNRPIHDPQREAEVFKLAEQLAKKHGADVALTLETVSLLIVHSKEIQCELLNRETFFDHRRPTNQVLRNNLLQLTKVTAKDYESRYCNGLEASALRTAREIESQQLVDTIRSLPRRDLALDLGCAQGSSTKVMAGAFQQTRAFDISGEMIEEARKRGPWATDVRFEVNDLFAGIPVESDSASLAVADCGAASEVCPAIFDEIARVLHCGGKALLSFYNREAIDTHSYYPSTVALRSHVNIFNDTVEVWYDGSIYVLHAEALTHTEIRRRAAEAGLTVTSLVSFPTLLSILSSYQCDREHRTQLAEDAACIDQHLMRDSLMRGHYLLAVLEK